MALTYGTISFPALEKVTYIIIHAHLECRLLVGNLLSENDHSVSLPLGAHVLHVVWFREVLF